MRSKNIDAALRIWRKKRGREQTLPLFPVEYPASKWRPTYVRELTLASVERAKVWTAKDFASYQQANLFKARGCNTACYCNSSWGDTHNWSPYA